MHPAVKLVIGLLLAVAGAYRSWMYWNELVALFKGCFGLFLVFIGLIVAWIEYEDLKWEMKEKQEKKEAPKEEEKPKRKRR